MDKTIFNLGFEAWLRWLETDRCWKFDDHGKSATDATISKTVNTGSRSELVFIARESLGKPIHWQIDLIYDDNYTVTLDEGFANLSDESDFNKVLKAAKRAIYFDLK